MSIAKLAEFHMKFDREILFFIKKETKLLGIYDSRNEIDSIEEYKDPISGNIEILNLGSNTYYQSDNVLMYSLEMFLERFKEEDFGVMDILFTKDSDILVKHPIISELLEIKNKLISKDFFKYKIKRMKYLKELNNFLSFFIEVNKEKKEQIKNLKFSNSAIEGFISEYY